MEHLKGASSTRAQALPSNIRLGCKSLHSSLLKHLQITDVKRFRAQCYATSYIRNLLIFVISYGVCPYKRFQPTLIFAGESGAYRSEGTFSCSTLEYPPGLPMKVECLFIEAAFHRMAFSLNAQFHLVFKTVSRISLALLHPKSLMI